MTAHSTSARLSAQREQLAAAWERTYAAGRQSPPPRLNTQAPISRSSADAQAAWRRWHAPKQASRFNAEQRPWYVALERARVETLASAGLPGMASNLSEGVSLGEQSAVLTRLYLVSREVFSHQPPTLKVLDHADTAEAYRWTTRLIRPLFSRRNRETTRAEDGHGSQALSEHFLIESLQKAGKVLEDSEAFTDHVVELVELLSGRYRIDTSSDENPEQPGSPSDSEQEDENAEEIVRTVLEDELAERDDHRQGYGVFSRRRDEERPASHWATAEDAMALRRLDILDRQRVRQLAHRLQRKLIAARQPRWGFDQEEGRLDSRRLARLVGDHPTQRVFRQEYAPPLPDACVTLLVDQSGSMSGRRRHMAALAIDLAVHTLETCQISCEVLGYTTRYAADNPLASQWRQIGAKEAPGRLNAVRHIVYKTAMQPWRRVRPHLGYLLRDMPGHENIDGEALHWAATRLSRRPEPHKVLIVLSDGAPYDKATVQANGRQFLDRHLRSGIAEIQSSPIHLAAIGTGQDVARFYQHVLTVRQPDEVAEKLFEQLAELLIPAQTARRAS